MPPLRAQQPPAACMKHPANATKREAERPGPPNESILSGQTRDYPVKRWPSRRTTGVRKLVSEQTKYHLPL